MTTDHLELMKSHSYQWPTVPLSKVPGWTILDDDYLARSMPESAKDLAIDSAWPAFFPAPVCLITTEADGQVLVEREVGASIVNRFPYVVAISLCREALSQRHHPRHQFMRALEASGSATIQFVEPGANMDRLLGAIGSLPDSRALERIAESGAKTRRGFATDAPLLADAYLTYEAELVEPHQDFEGHSIFEKPWMDVGSHRIYFLEIRGIGLRSDIASGERQIRWRALPAWRSARIESSRAVRDLDTEHYTKGYSPRYSFPSGNTSSFEYDEIIDGMAVKLLSRLPAGQVEVDNDRARWPCFFPSSAGLITTWSPTGEPNLMPCGSTTVVSRQPFTIAPCVSYANINVRYAPRKSLEFLSSSGRFGCSVPFISDSVVDAMKYAGNVSFVDDENKIANSGLELGPESKFGPVLAQAPIHFDCEIVDEVRLGTHMMYLGEVRRILVRRDVTPENPLEWLPLAGVTDSSEPFPT